MAPSSSERDWQVEFTRWLRPFLAALQREAQRRWAPVYLEGLLGPGERKSVAPMAARVAPADVQQLHHFVATSPWATARSSGCWRARPSGWWAGAAPC